MFLILFQLTSSVYCFCLSVDLENIKGIVNLTLLVTLDRASHIVEYK